MIVSAAVGAGLYLWLRSFPAAIVCFLSGFLVDLDHIIDYWFNYGIRFSTRHFFYVFREEPLRIIMVLFHAWEWLILLFVAAWLTRWNPLLIGLLAGMGNHLVLDHFFNAHSRAGYFLTFRLLKRFSGREFHGPEEHFRRYDRRGQGETENEHSTMNQA